MRKFKDRHGKEFKMNDKKFLKIKKQLIKELKELLDLMIFDSPIYNQFMKYDRVMDLYRLELIK